MSYPLKKYLTGFTLLELLVVMAIIGMLAAIVMPRIGGGKSTLLQSQAREAMAVLKYARRTAIIEGRTRYAIFLEGKQETKKPTANLQPNRWTSRGATLSWGGTLEQKSTEQEKVVTYEIAFYPEGGSSGGELIMEYEGIKIKIMVDELTGKVTSEFVDE